MTLRPVFAATALLLAAGPAPAQDRPLTTPTRDVDITYRLAIDGKPVEQRSRFAGNHIRIDTPSPGLYVLVDRDTHTMQLVSLGDRRVLDMPYRPQQAVGGVPADTGFVRLGTDVVAGAPCTEWRVDQPAGEPLIVCFTGDGVLLRVRSGANVLIQAARIAYGPIDPSVYAIPSGFQERKAPAR